ncbi:MAG: hypothetical protein JXM69_13880 [Anaerolineae bacterium]|nr:hypothetical protein [Anaerolineae bacterium]
MKFLYTERGNLRTTIRLLFGSGQLGSWNLALGLLLTGLGGAFLPWIWRESVALQLTGPGLAEFVKFLPEVRTLQLEIERLYFISPLFLAMLALPIFSENLNLTLPTWLRWLMRLVTIPLALASLSPVWTPSTLLASEFRLQTVLAGVAVGLAIIAPLLKKLSLRILVILLAGGGLIALIGPIWQFGLIQTSMTEVYHQPVSPGWGWWLTVTGIIMSLTGGGYVAFAGKPTRPR